MIVTHICLFLIGYCLGKIATMLKYAIHEHKKTFSDFDRGEK